MDSVVFKEIVSNPMFIGVLVLALGLLAAGIILRLFAGGFAIAKAFSNGVYDLTVLIFLYWIVFMFEIQYGAEMASGFVTNLPFISYFPNPFDAAALGTSDLGVAFWGELGRIWFINCQIELFTTVILDLFPGFGFAQHYFRQALVVIITIILNTILLYYMGQLFPAAVVDWIFTVLIIIAAIAFVVLGVLAFLFPLAGWIGSDLTGHLLAPTFTTAIAMIIAFLMQGVGLLQAVAQAINRFTEIDLMIYCVLVLLMFLFWALLYKLLRGK